MVTETIEQMIALMERKGWRLSNLSQIGQHGYSCILERKKIGDDGFGVYAANSGKLSQSAREAVADAWANAQQPVNNERVFRKIGAPRVQLTDLGKWLSDNVGYRLRLEDALAALVKSLTGEEDEADDFL